MSSPIVPPENQRVHSPAVEPSPAEEPTAASTSGFRDGYADQPTSSGRDPIGSTVEPPSYSGSQSERSRTRPEVVDSTFSESGKVGASDGAAPSRVVAPAHVEAADTAAVPIAETNSYPVDSYPEDVATPVPNRETVLARERDRFGGMKLGSAFFGWLAATGLAVLLLAVLAAAGVAFGVTTTANVDKAVQESQNATGTAKTVGLVGAIVLLLILFLAYYCGGYVAGRMARFNGVRQGFAVWLWAIVTSAIIAGLAATAGSKYNVLAQLRLPRIPVDEGSVTTVGLIAIGAAILAALLGALLGGALGTRYHRRVDAVGFEDL